MTDAKRDRQRAAREAKRAAEAAAARKALARRRARNLGIGLVVVGAVVAFSVSRGGDSGTDVTAGSTTTVAGDTGSAAGKPCVPVTDPLPAGAPSVPVQVGAPPTELVKEDLKPGTGPAVAAGATVTVNYIGVSCSTGKIFDTSYGKQPATFPLTQVIKGWTDGIPGMSVGGQRLLGIPAEQAYGAAGRPGTIAPDEPLWFVVEVLDAK